MLHHKLREDLPIIHLDPGDIYIATTPKILITILGSCVAVTAYSSELKIGGMTHSLYAKQGPKGTCAQRCGLACHSLREPEKASSYGECSTVYLINQLTQMGANPHKLKVHLFGGAAVLSSLNQTNSPIGEDNWRAVFEMLQRLHIPICKTDVGGKSGRKLFFNTGTGDYQIQQYQQSGE